MCGPVRPRGADDMKKPIAAAAEATYKEMKEEFKNETPQKQLETAIWRLGRNFTNLKVMCGSLQIFLDDMDTALSEKEEHELWAIEALLKQHLDHLEGYIDGASKYFEEVRK
jgi:hypothetical protein